MEQNEKKLKNETPYKVLTGAGVLIGGYGLAGKLLKAPRMAGIMARSTMVGDTNQFLRNKAAILKRDIDRVKIDGKNEEEIKKLKDEYNKINSHLISLIDDKNDIKAAEKRFGIKANPLSEKELEDIDVNIQQKRREAMADAEEKENKRINYLMAGGGATIGAGLYGVSNARQKNKEMLKQASEDEDNKYEGLMSDLSKDKTSGLLGLGLGMYGGSKLLESTKRIDEKRSEADGEYLKRLATKNKELEAINKKMLAEHKAVEALPKEDFQTYKNNLDEIEANKQELKNAATRQLLQNSSLAEMGEHLKWMSAAPLAVGAISYINSKVNKNNPSMIKNDDQAQTVNTLGQLGIIGGAGMLAGGLYRPLIRPIIKAKELQNKALEESANNFGKKVNYNDLDENMAKFLKRIKEAEKKVTHENGHTSKTREELANLFQEEAEENKNIAEKIPYKTDLKVAAAGTGLLGTGMTAASMTPDQKEYMDGINRRKLAENMLKKESSVATRATDRWGNEIGKAIEEAAEKHVKHDEHSHVGIGSRLGHATTGKIPFAGSLGTLASVGAAATAGGVPGALAFALLHVGQNLYARHLIDNGDVVRSMQKYVKEGNRGYTHQNEVADLGKGLHSGTLFPDNPVLREEMRAHGKKLKEKFGVDLDNLHPNDKIFLEAAAKGDIRTMLDFMHKSDIAHYILHHGHMSKGDLAPVFAGLDRAKSRLTEEDYKELSKEWQKTTGHFIANIFKGEEAGKVDLGGTLELSPKKLGKYIPDSIKKPINKFVDKASKLKEKAFYGKTKRNLKDSSNMEDLSHATGAFGTANEESGLGMWNITKPYMVATDPFVEKSAQGGIVQDFATGILGKQKKSGSTDATSLGISPTFALVNKTSGDTGDFIHKVMKKGLTKKEFEMFMDDLKNGQIGQMEAHPMRYLNNTKARAALEQTNLKNIDKNVKKNNMSKMDYEGKHDVAKVISKAIDNRGLDANDVVALGKQYKDDIFAKANEEATKAMAKLKDINTQKALNEASAAKERVAGEMGVSGVLGGATLLTAPTLYGTYKDYKDNRRTLKKTAEDNNNPDTATMLSGAALGASAGIGQHIYSNIENKNYIKKNIEQLKSMIQVDPREAHEFIKEMEKDPKLKKFTLSKEFEDLKQHTKDYRKKLEDVENLSDERKELDKLHKKYQKGHLDIDTNKTKGLLGSIINDYGRRLPTWNFPSEVVSNSDMKRIKHLYSEIFRKKSDVSKEFKKSFEGYSDGARKLNSLHGVIRDVEGVHPLKGVAKGVGGGLVGALGAIGIDKIYNEFEKSQYKDDEKPERTHPVPYLAAGTLAGALAGIGAGKIKNKLVTNKLIKDLEDPYVSNGYKGLLSTMTVAPHAGGTKFSSELEKSHRFYSNPSNEKLLPHINMSGLEHEIIEAQKANAVDNVLAGAASGGSLGLLLGGAEYHKYNSDKKDEDRVNRRLLKQSSDSNQEYGNHDNLIAATPLVAGGLYGTMIGHERGKTKQIESGVRLNSLKSIKEATKDLTQEEIKHNFNEHQIIDDIMDNHKYYGTNRRVMTDEEFNEYNKAKEKYNKLITDLEPEEKILSAFEKAHGAGIEAKKTKKVTGNFSVKDLNLSPEMIHMVNKHLGDVVDEKTGMAYRDLIDLDTNYKKAFSDEEKQAIKRKYEQKLRNVYNSYKKKDLERIKNKDIMNSHAAKAVNGTNSLVERIENMHNALPRTNAIKGGLIGLGVGGLGAALIKHDLNKNKGLNDEQ